MANEVKADKHKAVHVRCGIPYGLNQYNQTEISSLWGIS